MYDALLLLLSVATAAQPVDAIQAERKKLLGPWIAVSVEMDGKALTPADLKKHGLRKLKITFREEVVTLQSLGLLRSYRYRIDPANTPKAIDMALDRGERRGENRPCRRTEHYGKPWVPAGQIVRRPGRLRCCRLDHKSSESS
jgi:uncharacterized protein (TIGR03067 family)